MSGFINTISDKIIILTFIKYTFIKYTFSIVVTNGCWIQFYLVESLTSQIIITHSETVSPILTITP